MKKSKLKTVYVCNDCGAKFPTWSGRCSVCGAYNSITEEIISTTSLKPYITTKSVPKPINSIDVSYKGERLKTGYKNLDSALGGGFVLGQVVLLSGEPGIGKSTLLLKIASNISKVKRVLYVSGEESARQIYIRAKRLGVEDTELFVLSETNLEAILEGIESVNPGFIVFDSIQTLYSDLLESSAGSVSQVKYISGKITELSKSKGLISVIVGQVNKEGVIAGPKVLEHTVDTVVQFDGGKGYGYRILKITKNRFSSSGEMAVFNMTERGMEEVLDPSSFFLSEKPLNTSGSVIFPYTEGSKPILIEVQALVSKTFYPVPQRRAQGVDPNRLSIITAVLEKYLKINLKDRDIFVNVVGGIEVDDPAVDLPIAAAILSSYRDIPLPSSIAFFGEIGLTGEVRGVYFSDLRIKECEKMGIKRVVANLKEKFGNVDYIELNSVEDIAKTLPKLV
ncbi:MAG: DNA repair protein RadA [Hydrogenothermaceae bacterium]|nr:DNA repair protein RadA [Hydrogenothermaceae bacterium]